MAKKNGSTDKIKNDIQDLVNNFEKQFGMDDASTNDAIVDQKFNVMQTSEAMDFDELNPKFKKSAMDAIDSLYKFYLDIDVIDEDSYLNKKRNMHGVNLSGIYFQLKTMKTVLERLAEEITSGNMVPRLVEVYSSLNDKFSGAIKDHANYMLFMEDSIKQIPDDKDVTAALPGGKNLEVKHADDGDYYICASQKDLIDDIKKVGRSSDTVEDKGLTDPNSKNELMDKRGIDKKTIGGDKDDLSAYAGIMDLI